MAIFTVASFLAGNLVSTSMGFATRSSQLDALVIQAARVEVLVNALSKEYTVTDKINSNKIQEIQDHLTYEDRRLDKMEQRLEGHGK